MSSPEAAQQITKDVMKWLADQGYSDIDDIVPALFVAAIKIAVTYRGGEGNKLLDILHSFTRTVFQEELEKYERKVN